MITGTLMFDVAIEVEDSAALENLRNSIKAALKDIKGIDSTDEVDACLDDSKDNEVDPEQEAGE